MSNILDLSQVPGNVEITNNGEKAVKINVSGYNQSMPIEPGQTIIFKAQTSSELVGFLSQETDFISVKLPGEVEEKK